MFFYFRGYDNNITYKLISILPLVAVVFSRDKTCIAFGLSHHHFSLDRRLLLDKGLSTTAGLMHSASSICPRPRSSVHLVRGLSTLCLLVCGGHREALPPTANDSSGNVTIQATYYSNALSCDGHEPEDAIL